MVRDDVPNETQRSIVLRLPRPGQDDVLAPYVEKYLAAADTMWEEKGTQRASTALEYMFPQPLASQELLDRVDAWLETLTGQPGRQALRARGPRRRRPRAGRPGRDARADLTRRDRCPVGAAARSAGSPRAEAVRRIGELRQPCA